ncbi:MAG: serine hydrolase domain-containing protein [Bacillota bacterium]|nr:serine hydrolase domain-containing protein [Bacillota bacterium]
MSYTKRIVLALGLILVMLLGNTAWPQAMALSGEELPGAVEDYIEERKEGTAGLALAVFQGDEDLYVKYHGYADVENKIPVTEETVFEWGSVTKLLTWVSVMQLVEEGKLDLDRDIATWLPQGFLSKRRYPEPISLLDLMNHQAGFQEVIYGDEYQSPEDVSELAAALRLSEPPQIYAPGTVTAYSNYGAALAGFIVESVSGMPFYDYVDRHIFRVLGMERTSIKPGWSDKPWVAAKREETKTYSYYADQKESCGLQLAHIALYPAGSCAGTLGDFLTFAREFTRDRTKLFKDQAGMEAMLQPSLFYTGTADSRNHHGLWTIDYGCKLLGHGGNTEGCSSALWFDPLSRTGLAVMSNEVGEMSYNYGLLELLYGRPELSVVPDEDISGVYYSLRGFQEGFARIATYASGLLPIQREEEEGRFKAPIIDFSICSLGGGVYRQDSHNGLACNFHKVSGEPRLESYTTDYERLGPLGLVVPVVLILGALLVILYGIVNGVYVLLRKLRGKRLSRHALGSHLGLLGATLISAVFFYLWLFIASYEYGTVRLICLGLMMLMLLILANFIWQTVARWSGKNRRADLLRAAVSLLPLLTALYFQTYRFW